jgi:hypothetical protein
LLAALPVGTALFGVWLAGFVCREETAARLEGPSARAAAA